jgi:anti-sigma B factor antagonist
MKVEKRECIHTIITAERLDALDWPKLKDEVKELAQECGVHLVLDMGKTLFIDSIGCGEIVSLHKTLTMNQGEMRIARPTPRVLEILQLTRLHRVFEIYDSVESAVESFT